MSVRKSFGLTMLYAIKKLHVPFKFRHEAFCNLILGLFKGVCPFFF